MSYSVFKSFHENYGEIIQINRDDNGKYYTPFDALNEALKLKRLFKLKFFVDFKLLSMTKDLEKWADFEYKFLPKCFNCGFILKMNQEVFINKISDDSSLFCSQKCADSNFELFISHDSDYEDCECL